MSLVFGRGLALHLNEEMLVFPLGCLAVTHTGKSSRKQAKGFKFCLVPEVRSCQAQENPCAPLPLHTQEQEAAPAPVAKAVGPLPTLLLLLA